MIDLEEANLIIDDLLRQVRELEGETHRLTSDNKALNAMLVKVYQQLCEAEDHIIYRANLRPLQKHKHECNCKICKAFEFEISICGERMERENLYDLF